MPSSSSRIKLMSCTGGVAACRWALLPITPLSLPGCLLLFVPKIDVWARTCCPNGWASLLCCHNCFIMPLKTALCASRLPVSGSLWLFSVSRSCIRGLIPLSSGICRLPWDLISFAGDKLWHAAFLSQAAATDGTAEAGSARGCPVLLPRCQPPLLLL